MPQAIRTALGLGVATVLVLGSALLPGAAAHAGEAGGGARTEPTAADVQRFLDERVPALMAEHRLPGAVVSVVADGEQVFAGGYGEADVEAGTPVDAETTSFPIASVSKSFTAAAALQLVEQGRLDLHTDVNAYLPEDVRIPDSFPGEPVTLHHLLTHTAGFADSVAGMAAASPGGVLPLAEYAAAYRPERVHPPGRFVAYSNYGTTLVGLIVQEVSGVPFEEYTAENVFAPLGMERSGFHQPDEAAEILETPKLYTVAPDPAAPLYINQGPAGAVYATAPDMSRFMIALLNDGAAAGGDFLSPESTAAMLTRQASAHPRIAGAGYGTWDRYADGVHGIGHSGDLDGAHSEYVLLPEQELGFFVSVNADGVAESPIADGRARIVDAFLAEFGTPEPEQPGPGTEQGRSGADAEQGPGSDTEQEQPAPDASAIDLEPYVGTYTTTRTSSGEPASLLVVTDQTTVSATGDGRLHTTNALLGERDWTPVEQNLFRSDEGDQLAFIEEDGRVIGLALDAVPSQNYQRVDWHEQPYLHFGAAAAALLVMLTILAWPIAALTRLVLRRRPARTAAARTAVWTAAATVATCVGFVALLAYLMTDMAALTGLMFNDSPLLTAPLTAAAVLLLPVLAFTVTAWIRRWWTLTGRIHYTAIALSLAAFIDFGFHYGIVWTPPV
ncbi:serine hydrolase domain-containing protein [Allonocardiopsis opalescens]|uniref:CubicO group peptidase (Beta-lactamase class C family) n=1 Tax=Allonocardiopsis opalescens TaxID=1144618 RepID=A0A2T0Q2V0_9ACTN|nr:serine hydrolase domain-containing protein [Allonocardiopsis opalescens]PRX97998.1 CubicO group peptidase (beta-lactamase class C family) [Allonocardiopsis opalescens]